MRWSLILPFLLAACTFGDAPFGGVGMTLDTVAYSARRAEVEVLVKSNHPALISQIAAGGGPLLDEALQTAGVPIADRPARIIQLRADSQLYAASPGALVSALMLYAG